MNPTDILLSIAIVGIYTMIYVYLKSRFKNDKIRPEIINLFENAFQELIISSIPSKDILKKDEIKSINSLKEYQFIENLNDA